MKHISLLVMAILTLCFAACNNKPKEADATPAKKVSSLSPYTALLVQHTVADWDKWLPAFKGSDSLPKAAGLSNFAVARGLDNDKYVTVIATAADLQKAKDFTTSPGLRDAMANSGVTDTPKVSFLNVSFDDTTTIPQQERLMVTHHVKDYAAWKKAFDTEGDDARTANGLVLRLLAQSADDPNTVTIFFAITDMAKAKARVGSDDLKKLMTDAGVDGPPAITWFKWVNLN